VIEATVMDRRWQQVLDCLNAGRPPLAKGTLVSFRHRLIAQNLDRQLVERTVALAALTGGFGARALRALAGHLEPLAARHRASGPTRRTFRAPVIYPPLGALADTIGGLAVAGAVRLTS
jgi:hypothetical protein